IHPQPVPRSDRVQDRHGSSPQPSIRAKRDPSHSAAAGCAVFYDESPLEREICMGRWQRIAAVWLAAVAGCGGGGGSDSSAPVPVSVAIHWGARTRAMNAPSSALSVKITLLGAAGGGGDVVITVDRDPNPAEYTATAKSSVTARPGAWELHANFHAQRSGRGDVV